jgi:hypothetical protein
MSESVMLKRLRFAEPELEVPPLNEPLIVQDLLLDGIHLRAGRHIVKFVGFATTLGIGEPAERRIVSRFSVPLDVARVMWADLSDALGEEGGYGDRRQEVTAAQFRDREFDN